MATRGNAKKALLVRAYGTYFNLLSYIDRRAAGRRALLTFSKVRKGRILPEQEAFLSPAKDRVHHIAGHRIQGYRWPGNGPRVLLLHGWESNAFRWRNLIAFLREAGFDIMAFDAPAHGDSSGDYFYVPVYTECVEYLVQHYQPEVVVGHSVGGTTALYHNYKYPNEFVEKIVTIGSPSELHEIMQSYQSLLGFNNRVLAALDEQVREKFGFGIREFSTSEFVRDNQKAGLLLHDKHDRIAPFEASRRVHEAWEGSELVPTEGLGHSMHQEMVNRRIVDFLLKQ
ncbi:alpha/beta fold hydrolase [Robiginitalea sp. SC105]|uniref:alpha/beta fold hydrolase n=1 Tax=Robiginitalea sp. SC105 TaxID=2762332 RepID=UPI0016395301|nr:alpha/beta hydrolase [Robiginitalea sp. SC105]MBC2839683.1 alpha/beta hydrolase [Robiginitalea sp. SC105]